MFAQTCTHFLWDISFNLFATRVGWTEILKFINQHATNAMKCLTSETAPAELNRQLPPPPPPVSSRGILAGESTVKAWRSGRFMYWHGGTGRHAQAMTVRRFTGPARHTQKHVTVFGGGGGGLFSTGTAIQPLKVPISNRVWLCSHAGTPDIYDRWWLVCHAFGLRW
jgi:hypothetical protein